MPNREDIEKALKVLDLGPEATLKDVNEAREELLSLWDPKHLGGRPRLKVKAARKISEIQKAYSILLTHLSESRGRSREAEEGQVPEPEAVWVEPEEARSKKPPRTPSPSLFEEAFGDQLARKGRRIPVGALTGLAVVVVALAVYLLAPGGGPRFSVEDEDPNDRLAGSGPAVEEYEQGSRGWEDSPSASEPDGKRETGLQEPNEVRPSGNEPPAAREEASPQRPERAGGPALLREPVPDPVATEPAREESEPVEVAPEPEPESWGVAYNVLLERSTAARRLAAGGFPEMEFLEWRVVREETPEVWINLLARRTADSSEIHCVWSVNLEEESVTALSHLARDLEHRVAGR